jgi:glycosyltransferase involved in cell wall biosynthesis
VGSAESLEKGGEAGWPRITLVTPVRNSVGLLEQTIRSVLAQDYPNLDYFIVDGGSTDGSVDVIRKYEGQISGWMSEPDKGMYDALNKGFAQASGEVLGWINAGDLLHSSGLLVVGSVFAKFPEVEWITGRPTGFNSGGMTTHVDKLKRWSRYRFLAGANQYIQQESTFWRRSLWERAGGRVDSAYRDVGDFELWARFFRHARLYSVEGLIAGYRFHPDAISYVGRKAYDRGCNEIIERELRSTPRGIAIRFFRLLSQGMMRIPVVKRVWNRTVIRGLYRLPGPDWAPFIECGSEGWVMRR